MGEREEYKVQIEPIGEEILCNSDETILDAAFRNGYSLAHGCREGRCSACKAFVLDDGWLFLGNHSTFALTEEEEEAGYTLLCRAVPESDVTIELLHYDLDNYRLQNRIVTGTGRITELTELTHDIRHLVIDIETPLNFAFMPGQYVDLRVPGGSSKRSYSMANLPGSSVLEFIIKTYEGGKFSSLLESQLAVGDEIEFTGPYGSCYLRGKGPRNILLVAGGSGMAPILALLRQLSLEGDSYNVRFIYGARREADVFYENVIEGLGIALNSFEFSVVLSDEERSATCSHRYEKGWVHEAVGRWAEENSVADHDVYMCGPPPMISATSELLEGRYGVDQSRIFTDSFTFSGDD